ncbi:MAG: hypothetical protein AABX54_03255 [Nanoarchaeota archaeon]
MKKGNKKSRKIGEGNNILKLVLIGLIGIVLICLIGLSLISAYVEDTCCYLPSGKGGCDDNNIFHVLVCQNVGESCLKWRYLRTCPSPLTCSNGNCIACAQKTCIQLGKQCGGPYSNGCGGTVTCPTCPTGKTCNANGQCVAICNSQTCTTTNPCKTATCGVSGGCQITDESDETICAFTSGTEKNGVCKTGECVLKLKYYDALDKVCLGYTFSVECDFGVPFLGCVNAVHEGGICNFIKYEGTKSIWNCTAQKEGLQKNYCNIFDLSGDAKCKAQTNEIMPTIVDKCGNDIENPEEDNEKICSYSYMTGSNQGCQDKEKEFLMPSSGTCPTSPKGLGECQPEFIIGTPGPSPSVGPSFYLYSPIIAEKDKGCIDALNIILKEGKIIEKKEYESTDDLLNKRLNNLPTGVLNKLKKLIESMREGAISYNDMENFLNDKTFTLDTINVPKTRDCKWGNSWFGDMKTSQYNAPTKVAIFKLNGAYMLFKQKGNQKEKTGHPNDKEGIYNKKDCTYPGETLRTGPKEISIDTRWYFIGIFSDNQPMDEILSTTEEDISNAERNAQELEFILHLIPLGYATDLASQGDWPSAIVWGGIDIVFLAAPVKGLPAGLSKTLNLGADVISVSLAVPGAINIYQGDPNFADVISVLIASGIGGKVTYTTVRYGINTPKGQEILAKLKKGGGCFKKDPFEGDYLGQGKTLPIDKKKDPCCNLGGGKVCGIPSSPSCDFSIGDNVIFFLGGKETVGKITGVSTGQITKVSTNMHGLKGNNPITINKEFLRYLNSEELSRYPDLRGKGLGCRQTIKLAETKEWVLNELANDPMEKEIIEALQNPKERSDFINRRINKNNVPGLDIREVAPGYVDNGQVYVDNGMPGTAEEYSIATIRRQYPGSSIYNAGAIIGDRMFLEGPYDMLSASKQLKLTKEFMHEYHFWKARKNWGTRSAIPLISDCNNVVDTPARSLDMFIQFMSMGGK